MRQISRKDHNQRAGNRQISQRDPFKRPINRRSQRRFRWQGFSLIPLRNEDRYTCSGFRRTYAGLPTRRKLISLIFSPRRAAHSAFPDPKRPSTFSLDLSVLFSVSSVLSLLSSRQLKTLHPRRRASLSILQEGFTAAACPTASSIQRSLQLSPYA